MIEQATVTLTTEALSQLRSLLEREANPALGLRVFVSGGGCSGLQYGMVFDDNERPGDMIVQQDGVRVLVDDFSAPYLEGSEIHYVDSLMRAGFTVLNPNPVRSCSSGHLFDTGLVAGTSWCWGSSH